MSESAHVLIPLGCFVLFVVGSIALGNRSARRRTEAFARWAGEYGAELERLGERSFRFLVNAADRQLEVRDAYRGGGIGVSTSAVPYLTVSGRLRGRSWDLHSVDVKQRWPKGDTFDTAFKVEDLGMPMREGWLTPAVRSAITASFAPAHRLAKVSIDGGDLVFLIAASPGQLSKQILDALVAAHSQLATSIERAR